MWHLYFLSTLLYEKKNWFGFSLSVVYLLLLTFSRPSNTQAIQIERIPKRQCTDEGHERLRAKGNKNATTQLQGNQVVSAWNSINIEIIADFSVFLGRCAHFLVCGSFVCVSGGGLLFVRFFFYVPFLVRERPIANENLIVCDICTRFERNAWEQLLFGESRSVLGVYSMDAASNSGFFSRVSVKLSSTRRVRIHRSCSDELQILWLTSFEYLRFLIKPSRNCSIHFLRSLNLIFSSNPFSFKSVDFTSWKGKIAPLANFIDW